MLRQRRTSSCRARQREMMTRTIKQKQFVVIVVVAGVVVVVVVKACPRTHNVVLLNVILSV